MCVTDGKHASSSAGLRDELFKVFPIQNASRLLPVRVFVQRFGDLISNPTNRVKELQREGQKKCESWRMRLCHAILSAFRSSLISGLLTTSDSV